MAKGKAEPPRDARVAAVAVTRTIFGLSAFRSGTRLRIKKGSFGTWLGTYSFEGTARNIESSESRFELLIHARARALGRQIEVPAHMTFVAVGAHAVAFSGEARRDPTAKIERVSRTLVLIRPVTTHRLRFRDTNDGKIIEIEWDPARQELTMRYDRKLIVLGI
jgi:hypothetical protein